MSPKTSFAIRYSLALAAVGYIGWLLGEVFNDEIEDLFLN